MKKFVLIWTVICSAILTYNVTCVDSSLERSEKHLLEIGLTN